MTSDFQISLIDSPQEMPARELVSAVFLVGFKGGNVLAARNERGWDIPGGHLEEGESLLAGLRREVREEAGATFEKAVPFAALSRPGHAKSMIFFAADGCKMEGFEAKEDAFERCLLEPEQLVARYRGDQRLLARLIRHASRKLGEIPASGGV